MVVKMALTEKQIEENQNQFKKLLLSVEREFIGNVYNQLEINNFFKFIMIIGGL